MNPQHLRTLLAVLEHESFSTAAASLGVTQSTVSFQVRALEEATGARLLDRSHGRVRATPAGEQLRRDARRLLALEEAALARVRAVEDGEAGELRLVASTIPAEYLLPPVLARFRRARPRVRVVVLASDSRAAIARLLAEEADLALVGARPTDRRVLSHPFAQDEVVLVGPRGARPSLAPTELATIPFVLREEGSGTQQAVSELLARHGIAREELAVAVETGSTEAAKRCVLAGLGHAFLSRHAVADELAAGRLVRVKLAGTPVRRSFHVASRRGETPSAAARALRTLLDRKTR